ncbi:MAG: M48 family metalloprotease [Candidatus Omnitrophica bacterium]|nr:M48 family metalloprotease [Candidatus Omnitrophota bacterium]MDD5574420.1 M48 family metalloprotease [Candidatus Omnitrophota bacterium]
MRRRSSVRDPGRKYRVKYERTPKRSFCFFCCLWVAVCGLFFLTGCATVYNPATGRHDVLLIDSVQEVQIGRGMAQQVVAQAYDPWNHPVEQRHLNEMGRQLARVSDRPDIIYHFQILDAPEYNAFALPGGYIYIFRGLYERLDEAQRAAVLAHEIAHVAAKHAVKRMQAALGYDMLAGLVLAGLGNKDPRMAEQVAGVSRTVFDLLSRGYSRQDEIQADGLAVKYLARGGVDPQAMVRSLEFLMKEEGPGGRTFEILSTHPRMEERIRKAQEEVNRLEQGKRR